MMKYITRGFNEALKNILFSHCFQRSSNWNIVTLMVGKGAERESLSTGHLPPLVPETQLGWSYL
jgi:hypothetical protein